jgi:hypothetical protein
MIQLPDNWRRMVQVREHQQSHGREVGILELVLNNDAGQVFGFEMPVAIPYYLSAQLNKHDLKQFYEIAYNSLCAEVQNLALQQKNVFGRNNETDELEVQPVRDQAWDMLPDATNMLDYDTFILNLERG